LLSELEKSGSYLDPSAKNIANIINAHRIFAIHFKKESKLPIPSELDSAAIMFFALSLIERCVLDKTAII